MVYLLEEKVGPNPFQRKGRLSFYKDADPEHTEHSFLVSFTNLLLLYVSKVLEETDCRLRLVEMKSNIRK